MPVFAEQDKAGEKDSEGPAPREIASVRLHHPRLAAPFKREDSVARKDRFTARMTRTLKAAHVRLAFLEKIN
jgi:hypothetical protein